MSIQAGIGKLSDASKELALAWSRVRPGWRDKVAQDFEKEFIEPMDPKVKRAAQAMVALAEVLHKARKECE